METNLYRKYRPVNFEQIVGQNVAVTTLKNSIINDTISHAYLFSGVRGTGKTSIAKIFAKAVNCEDNQNPFCGKCEYCLEFARVSEVPDIFEIDAASNNGVDEIRKIIENIKYMPIQLKYKVYIIDEVHMLSKGAFNAILKTLEEPPKHVIFILATTEPNKIPVTILSRVQRFDFSRIDDELILAHLCHVLDQEHVKYDVEALKLIVPHAQGGMRDALSLLTKALAFKNEITIDSIETSLNLTALSVTDELLQLILNNKPNEVSEKYNTLIKNGADEVYLIQDLISLTKTKMIASLKAQSEDSHLYPKIIKKLMDILGNLKMISNKSLYLEVALIDLAIKHEQIEPQVIVEARQNQSVENEQVKINSLQSQVDQLKAQSSSSEQPNEDLNNDEIEVQIDELFSNQTIEENNDEHMETVSMQEIIENDQSIASELIEIEPKQLVNPVEKEIEKEPITIIDTLMNATNNDKKQCKIASQKCVVTLNDQKQYGIAKFFEVSVVQGASTTGVVVTIDENLFESYEKRIQTITDEFSKQIGHEMKVHLLTTQYWMKERVNFIHAIKKNKSVDIYQEAIEFFGKDKVNKVNS